jgi:3-hydroxybutyryl-CoA dehydrogenase
MWEQGVASAEDIDRAVRGSFGFRLPSIGPLLTFDLAGEDTIYTISRYLFPLISDAHEPPEAIRKLVEEGNLGEKTGNGVFDYTREQWDSIIKQRDKEFLQRLKALYWAKE